MWRLTILIFCLWVLNVIYNNMTSPSVEDRRCLAAMSWGLGCFRNGQYVPLGPPRDML